MLEIKLTVLFLVCLTAALIFLLIIIKDDYIDSSDRKSYFILPIAANTDNIEIIIRNVVFKAFEYYDDPYVVFVDYGASDDVKEIINVLMRNFENYTVIKYSDELMQNII